MTVGVAGGPCMRGSDDDEASTIEPVSPVAAKLGHRRPFDDDIR